MLLVLGNGRGCSSIPAALFSVSCGRRTKKVPKRPPGQVPTGGEGLGRGAFEGGPITWRCVEGCGACCKLDKGPSFLTPEEIFSDPSDVRLYRSMVGPDGWCIHYDQPSRTCSIYQGRPHFCRVEPQVFLDLYGIKEKKFHKEACGFCKDTIKAIYGPNSRELDNFNRNLRRSNV